MLRTMAQFSNSNADRGRCEFTLEELLAHTKWPQERLNDAMAFQGATMGQMKTQTDHSVYFQYAASPVPTPHTQLITIPHPPYAPVKISGWVVRGQAHHTRANPDWKKSSS